MEAVARITSTDYLSSGLLASSPTPYRATLKNTTPHKIAPNQVLPFPTPQHAWPQEIKGGRSTTKSFCLCSDRRRNVISSCDRRRRIPIRDRYHTAVWSRNTGLKFLYTEGRGGHILYAGRGGVKHIDANVSK